MANASRKSMGAHANGQHGHRPVGPSDTEFGQSDIASDLMGNNRLMGNDQRSTHTERQTMADEKSEPDANILESFEKMDKDVRAETELGKGNRSGG